MQNVSRVTALPESDDQVRARLMAAARELAPRIAQRAAADEKARRISDDTIREAGEAGFFRILVPKKLGGYELDWETACRVVIECGHGDGSSAWQIGFFILHNWFYLLLPEKAQEEIYGKRGYGLGPVMLAPSSVTCRKVDGGYVLSGRSRWATGINHAEWVFVATKLSTDKPSNDAKPKLYYLLVPAKDVIIHDTWNTSGMCATGSHDVEYPDVFVPEHRASDFDAGLAGNGLGFNRFEGPKYHLPTFLSMIFGATAPQLAIARGAIDTFHTKIKNYTSPLFGQKTIDTVPALVRLAQAKIRYDAAEQHLYSLARRMLEWNAAGELTPERRVMIRAGCAWAANEAREVVQKVAATSGSGAYMRDQPLQRYLRDSTMMANHFYFDQDTAYEPYGRVLAGLDPNTRLA
jgi:3-hydroxy-9,10-secoandrosta-1,3,5(10)-triene-9,17-dione monooxygenase